MLCFGLPIPRATLRAADRRVARPDYFCDRGCCCVAYMDISGRSATMRAASANQITAFKTATETNFISDSLMHRDPGRLPDRLARCHAAVHHKFAADSPLRLPA